MFRSRLHVVTIALLLGLAACVSSGQPKLKVLSVEQTARPAPQSSAMVLFVEVTNPASRPLRLQRLQYSFEASVKVAGVEPVVGEVLLSRTVEAGAAVVVEVPLTLDRALPVGEEMTLAGRLYATQDELQRSFVVSAKIDAL
jgi:hypothetical protein